jgi:hypothetical protein
MKNLKLVMLLGLGLMLTPKAHAAVVSVHVGVGAPVVLAPAPVLVGAPPACAYGYYDYYPYACAPYGFYGPNYFVGGVFIGAGPWFHGFAGRPAFHPLPSRFNRGWTVPAHPVVRSFRSGERR